MPWSEASSSSLPRSSTWPQVVTSCGALDKRVFTLVSYLKISFLPSLDLFVLFFVPPAILAYKLAPFTIQQVIHLYTTAICWCRTTVYLLRSKSSHPFYHFSCSELHLKAVAPSCCYYRCWNSIMPNEAMKLNEIVFFSSDISVQSKSRIYFGVLSFNGICVWYDMSFVKFLKVNHVFLGSLTNSVS